MRTTRGTLSFSERRRVHEPAQDALEPVPHDSASSHRANRNRASSRSATSCIALSRLQDSNINNVSGDPRSPQKSSFLLLGSKQ